MSNDLLDLTLLLEFGKGATGERSVDLQTVDKDGDRDKTVGLDILLELVVGGLVEGDGVLGLVLDYIEQSGQRLILLHFWQTARSDEESLGCQRTAIVRTLALGPLLLLLLAAGCCGCHFVD